MRECVRLNDPKPQALSIFIFSEPFEITFSKEDVVSDIEDLRWLKRWSFMNDLDPELREYFRKQMKLNLTLDNLDRYWGEARAPQRCGRITA